jgi:glycosyltransferase involved in cell wall biosynthesis
VKLLFVHQAYPAQYRYLARALAASPKNEVVALADRARVDRYGSDIGGVRVVGYQPPQLDPGRLGETETMRSAFLQRGRAAEAAATDLERAGFRPDVIFAHASFGDAAFLKDVFPRARSIVYCEYFFRAQGGDIGFDPEFPGYGDVHARIRVANAPAIAALDAAERGLSPMNWQREQFPERYRGRIAVIHEGIDTGNLAPEEQPARDELITYVSRSLEPHRGFHVFMRAIPALQKLRPRARIVIVGGDEVSYSQALPGGETYRGRLLKEIDGKADLSRVRFAGRVPFDQYIALLRQSSAHVYLTYPFVLSWSLLEAMSLGCLVVGSRTPPVEEVIRHGENGLLADFFSPEAIAETVADAVARGAELRPLRAAARRTAVEGYDFTTVCLPRHLELIREVVSK